MYEISSERLSPGEYIDFLKRTDLGSQYSVMVYDHADWTDFTVQ